MDEVGEKQKKKQTRKQNISLLQAQCLGGAGSDSVLWKSEAAHAMSPSPVPCPATTHLELLAISEFLLSLLSARTWQGLATPTSTSHGPLLPDVGICLQRRESRVGDRFASVLCLTCTQPARISIISVFQGRDSLLPLYLLNYLPL